MPPNARRRNRVERAARSDRWRHAGGPSKLADPPSKHSRASRTVMRVNVPTVRRAILLTAVLSTTAVGAQTLPAGKITTPKEFFGFNIGDDWKLANYDQFQEYWKKIDAES